MRAQIALLVAATIVCGITIFYSQRRDSFERAGARQNIPIPDNVAATSQILSKLEDLEQRLDLIERVQRTPSQLAPQLEGDSAMNPTPIANIEELRVELQELRQRLGDLELEPPKFETLPFRVGRVPPTAEGVAELHQDLRDRARGNDERLRALRALRGIPQRLQPHAPVAQDIVTWLDQSHDPAVREDIIRQLHGARVDDLVEPLLHYLRHDESDGVREEAAETLDDYLDQPGVREALSYAQQHDSSEKVRRVAGESLLGGERR